MKDQAVPGLRMGIRLVLVCGFVGLVSGLAVGALIWGDDEYWAELGMAFGGIIGCLGGATCGLAIWLVRLWAAGARVAGAATVGALGGIAAWTVAVCINGTLAWLVVVTVPAIVLSFAATLIASDLRR